MDAHPTDDMDAYLFNLKPIYKYVRGHNKGGRLTMGEAVTKAAETKAKSTGRVIVRRMI